MQTEEHAMSRTDRCLLITILFLSASTGKSAIAANSVVVESKAVGASAANVPIRVLLTNDQDLDALIVPLEIRSVTPGSFITSLRLSYAERLPASGPPLSSKTNNQYAAPSSGCYTSVSFSDGLTHPVIASPEGVLFYRANGGDGRLTPGSDASGSLVMTVTVTGTLGTFEIDTACITPFHLNFTGDSENNFIPSFTKGTITIATDSDGDGVPNITDNCPSIARRFHRPRIQHDRRGRYL
jgi:hypothetical protein